jgi:hypothetical protein
VDGCIILRLGAPGRSHAMFSYETGEFSWEQKKTNFNNSRRRKRGGVDGDRLNPSPRCRFQYWLGVSFSFWVYKQWDGGNEMARDGLWDGNFHGSSSRLWRGVCFAGRDERERNGVRPKQATIYHFCFFYSANSPWAERGGHGGDLGWARGLRFTCTYKPSLKCWTS